MRHLKKVRNAAICLQNDLKITISAEYHQFNEIEEIYKNSMIASSGCQRNCISWTYENEVQDVEKEGKNYGKELKT